MFKHIDWGVIEQSCLNLHKRIVADNYKPNCIIGLMKGGIIPARLFADYFDVPFEFYALNVSSYKGIAHMKENLWITSFQHTLSDKKVLIVDDIWDSGRTMKGILDYLNPSEELRNNNPFFHNVPINEKTTIKTATLYWKDGAVGVPNYYDQIAFKEEWIVFPWEKVDFEREKIKLGKKGK